MTAHYSRQPRRIAARTAELALAAAVLAAALAGVPRAGAAQTQLEETPPLQPGRIAGQIALGTVGTVGGFVGGGLATRAVARRMGASEERASQLAYVGGWTTAALATAGGATLIGRHGRVTGSYAAALGGTVAGGLTSYLLVRLCDNEGPGSRCGPLAPVAGLAVFLLPSIGATVGFNASREYR